MAAMPNWLHAAQAQPIDHRMGQQHRVRAKRKRRKAYLERRKAKLKAMQREPARAKPKKVAPPLSAAAAE